MDATGTPRRYLVAFTNPMAIGGLDSHVRPRIYMTVYSAPVTSQETALARTPTHPWDGGGHLTCAIASESCRNLCLLFLSERLRAPSPSSDPVSRLGTYSVTPLSIFLPARARSRRQPRPSGLIHIGIRGLRGQIGFPGRRRKSKTELDRCICTKVCTGTLSEFSVCLCSPQQPSPRVPKTK